MLKYKGYTGYVVYDDEARIFMERLRLLRLSLPFKANQ